MRDLDTAFGELRRAVTDELVAPDAAAILGRARRRTRTRIAASAATLAVVLGGTAFAVNGGDDRAGPPPVLTTPSARPQPPRLPVLADLIHGRQVRPIDNTGSPNRWVRSVANDSDFPSCKHTVELDGIFDDSRPEIRSALVLSYDGNREQGNEPTSTSRSETVIVFADTDQARAAMRTLRSAATDCGGDGLDEFTRLDFGNEAFRGAMRVREPGGPNTQRQQGVMVRQGAALAVFASMRNNGRELVSLERLEQEARTMAERLAGLGYGD
ncbi:hypothetical protein GCM10009678_20750 [Actinomadura kijaniata]|uniref:PknH-like extracellular domain-containing protein n=1 Tax=Actinomadura namibiensis TaxID=182080 RepID=A0A7W3LJ08_ACTNM|nr:hypothetical protein [Actinomadura namibiensis]MBA8949057.1 hypothetical protein [Actinomadura namibiensis]